MGSKEQWKNGRMEEWIESLKGIQDPQGEQGLRDRQLI